MSGAAAGSSFGPWGAAAGGAMGALGGFGDDPSDQANKYYDKIPGMMKGYYDPYINNGKWADSKLQGQYGEMSQDPNDIIKHIGEGYQKSPGYDWRLKQGEGAIGSANAAGGMAGTQQHMQQSGQLAENMASEDYDKYMQQALGVYGGNMDRRMNLAGGMSQQGYNASSSLADNIGNVLMGQGSMAYAQGNNSDQTMGSTMGRFGEDFGRYGNGANGSKGKSWLGGRG
jgi:hypothetical protein